MCDRMNIDVWEVIDAAATKPFGYMPFILVRVSAGHCIPIDPFYLSWKSKGSRRLKRGSLSLRATSTARMPEFVVEKIQNALNDASKPCVVRGCMFWESPISATSMTFANRRPSTSLPC